MNEMQDWSVIRVADEQFKVLAHSKYAIDHLKTEGIEEKKYITIYGGRNLTEFFMRQSVSTNVFHVNMN